MYMNRFITGAVLGGAIGAIGAAYALSSNNQKKQMMKKGRQLIDMTNHRIKEMM